MLHVAGSLDASLIEIDGELDIDSSGALKNALRIAGASPIWRIVLSFANCTYCDMSGLNVVVCARAALGNRLLIVVPHGHSVRRTLELTGLITTVACYATFDDALRVPVRA